MLKKFIGLVLVGTYLLAIGSQAKTPTVPPTKESEPVAVTKNKKIKSMLEEISDFSSGKPGLTQLSQKMSDGTIKNYEVKLIVFNLSILFIKDRELILTENSSGDVNNPVLKKAEIYIIITEGETKASDKLTDEDLKIILPVLSAKFNAFFNSKEMVSLSEELI